jgi:hypothetical protein
MVLGLVLPVVGWSQAPPPPAGPNGPPPPMFTPHQLEQMVARIALYPDPLLAQVLAAATFPDQIPEAARWADEHHYLTGRALAAAIQADDLPWDPSVQALLPFPSVLDMMARDMGWTRDLGDAFLAQQADVMDAVQRQRRRARDYGYLVTNRWVVVSGGPYITIVPINPAYMPLPYYDPAIVYFPPPRGIVVGTVIRFGYGISLGIYFRPWGWGYSRFDWGRHVVILNNAPWGRTWVNRRVYVHPYPALRPYAPPRPPERHEARPRTEHERQGPQEGRRSEEHRGRSRH